MDSRNGKKSFGIRLLSVLMAVIASAMILYGVSQIALSASLSDKNMHRLAEEIDTDAYVKNPSLIKAVNTAIYKWTNAFAGASVYATEETMPYFYDIQTVRDFLGDVFSKMAHSLKTGDGFTLSIDEAMPLTETLRTHISQQLGVEITSEQCADELENALHISEINIPFPHMVHFGLGVALIVVAVILLATDLLIRDDNLFLGGMFIALAFCLPAIVLLGASHFVKPDMFVLYYFPLISWIEMLQKSLHTFGLLCLIPMSVGIVIMIAYWIDKKHVDKLSANRRRGDSDI